MLTAAQVQTMAKIGFKVLLAQMLALQETLTIISVPGSATTEVDQSAETVTVALLAYTTPQGVPLPPNAVPVVSSTAAA